MPDNHGHAPVSPSGAHSWRHCTRGPRFALSLDIPDEGSAWASEGTIAHWLCEQWLKTGVRPDMTVRMDVAEGDDTPFVVKSGGFDTADMAEHVQCYVEYVTGLVDSASRHELLVEHRVDINHWIPGMFGSADSVILADYVDDQPTMLYMNDFKYGLGVRVAADDDPDGPVPRPNPQLTLYALGLLTDSIANVRLSIIQPRVHNVVWVDLSRAQLLDAAAPLVAAGTAAYEGMGRFEASPEICRFCNALGWCRTAMRASGLVLGRDGRVA